jgi:hypothetical protein
VEARRLFPSDSFYDGNITVITADHLLRTARRRGGAIEPLIQSMQPARRHRTPRPAGRDASPSSRKTSQARSGSADGHRRRQAEHLAFTAPGLDWEVWIGATDKLPRLMIVSYRSGERQPTFTVELAEWKLNAAVPAKTFSATIPPGALKLEFKQMGPAK